MADHPVTRMIKRGGSYRRAYFIQPYMPINPDRSPRCDDVYRVVLMDV